METDVAPLTVQAVALANATHPIRLTGACSFNGGPDTACVAIAVSLDRLLVETESAVAFLDNAIINLPHLGIVEAVVAGVFDGGFELRFDPAPQSKLGILVAWIERARSSIDTVNHESRAYERIVPIKRLTTLSREGEPTSLIRIVDLSRSGAAFTTSKAPIERERVRVGALPGEVVRSVDGGAAVRFDRPIPAQAFDVLIDLDVATLEDASPERRGAATA